MSERAASEALRDADVDWDSVDRNRFACAICGHMGDASFVERDLGLLNAEDHWLVARAVVSGHGLYAGCGSLRLGWSSIFTLDGLCEFFDQCARGDAVRFAISSATLRWRVARTQFTR